MVLGSQHLVGRDTTSSRLYCVAGGRGPRITVVPDRYRRASKRERVLELRVLGTPLGADLAAYLDQTQVDVEPASFVRKCPYGGVQICL